MERRKGGWLPASSEWIDGSGGPICVQSCYKSDDDYIVEGEMLMYPCVYAFYTHGFVQRVRRVNELPGMKTSEKCSNHACRTFYDIE